MKTVFSNNSELAHKWAYNNGFFRTGNGNMFTQDITIFSYGSHFPIATKIERKNKETMILFNSASYSNSTSKHQNEVRRAISHLDIFTVPNVYDDKRSHRDNIQYYFDEIQEKLKKASTARSNKPYLIDSANCLLTELKVYIKIFKKGLNLRFNNAQKEVLKVENFCNENDTIETLKIAVKLKQKNDRIAYNKRNKDALEKAELDLEKWINGESNYLPYSSLITKIYLRINSEHTAIQTSQGACVPVDQAKRLYKMIVAKSDVIGEKIGDFTVLSVNGTVKIGCHNIEMNEVVRLAKSLNW